MVPKRMQVAIREIAKRWMRIVLLTSVSLNVGCDDSTGINFPRPPLPSPDGSLEAVVRTIDGGATTGIATEVYIRKRGDSDLPKAQEVVHGDDWDGFQMSWLDNQTLALSFTAVSILRFRGSVDVSPTRTVFAELQPEALGRWSPRNTPANTKIFRSADRP